MRGDWGNHYEKLGLENFECYSQFTIPDPAGMTSDPAGTNTDTRNSKPDRAGRTSYFPHSLVSSHIVPISIPHLSLSRPQLYYHRKHEVKSSLSTSPCHDHEFTPSTAFTQDRLSPAPSQSLCILTITS